MAKRKILEGAGARRPHHWSDWWQLTLICVAASLLLTTSSWCQEKNGYFGRLVITPVEPFDGVHWRTTEAFGFVDAKGRKWEVPAGSVTDGASIPKLLWSPVGSPFSGKYVAAAVIHDRFCDTKYRSWRATHDTFYDAMIASGVDKLQALIMWSGVFRFGPRWTQAESVCWDTCAGQNLYLDNVTIMPEYVKGEHERITDYVQRYPTISKAQLEKFIEDNTFDDPKTFLPYGARLRGYISGTQTDEENRHSATRKKDVIFGEEERRYADRSAPANWRNFGDVGGMYLNTVYRVVRVKSGDSLQMRGGAGTGFKPVGNIPAGATGITVVGRCNTQWCRVRYGADEGWVNTAFLAVDWRNSSQRDKGN